MARRDQKSMFEIPRSSNWSASVVDDLVRSSPSDTRN